MRFVHLVFLICLLGCPSIDASATDTCQTLTATGGPSFAPAAWVRDGQVIGYMPEMVRTIGHSLGLNVEILTSGQWKRVLANVEGGQIDLVMGLLKNAERLDKFDYTISVAKEPVVVAALKNTRLSFNGEWSSLKPYRGSKILGVQFGTRLNEFLANELDIFVTPNYVSLFRQMNHSRIDYVIASRFALEFNASDVGILKDLAIYDPPLSEDDIYMAFSKRSQCRHLASDFSGEIEKLRKDGTVAKLIAKYRQIRLQQ